MAHHWVVEHLEVLPHLVVVDSPGSHTDMNTAAVDSLDNRMDMNTAEVDTQMSHIQDGHMHLNTLDILNAVVMGDILDIAVEGAVALLKGADTLDTVEGLRREDILDTAKGAAVLMNGEDILDTVEGAVVKEAAAEAADDPPLM